MRRGKSAWRGWRIGAVLMLAGGPASAECGPPALERAVLQRVTAEGDLLLADARMLRLAGLHLAAPPAVLLPRPGAALAIGLLDDQPDRWGRLPVIAFALPDAGPPVWLQQLLIERGAALARPESRLGGCWLLLARAEAAVGPALPDTIAEAGRFARVSGRVVRVGEGRSAHFIAVREADGASATGLVQKRHLKRFLDAGVDVANLRGHVIRLRGVRSATNPAIIPLINVEQIEIVR